MVTVGLYFLLLMVVPFFMQKPELVPVLNRNSYSEISLDV